MRLWNAPSLEPRDRASLLVGRVRRCKSVMRVVILFTFQLQWADAPDG
jgi:hypothetical protein